MDPQGQNNGEGLDNSVVSRHKDCAPVLALLRQLGLLESCCLFFIPILRQLVAENSDNELLSLHELVATCVIVQNN